MELIWIKEDMQGLCLVKPFAPVYTYDSVEKKYTDVQAKDEQGNWLWQSEALLQTGYRAELTPVKVRTRTTSPHQPPKAKPDPMELLALFGADEVQVLTDER